MQGTCFKLGFLVSCVKHDLVTIPMVCRPQAKVDELRRLPAVTQTELDALLPSVLAKAFAGEL